MLLTAHRLWTLEVEAQLEQRHRGSQHTRVNCPACATRAGKLDRDRSASVNTGNGWVKCFRCGWRTRISGDWGDFDLVELADPDAFDGCGVEQPSSYAPVTRDLGQLYPRVLEYLRGRCIAPWIVEQALVGFAWEGEHAGRLILPAVASPDWRGVGWCGRVVGEGDKRRRYHQAEGMDTRSSFYNDDRLGEDVEYHVVVEGPVDALRHWPVCLGSWGKPRPEQLDRLIRRQRPVVFVGDADAWREYLAAAQQLRAALCPAWAVRLPVGIDPALIPRKDFTGAVEYALVHKTDVELS